MPALLGALYMGVVPTGIGFTTWYQALHSLSTAELGIFQYLTPIVTIFLAVLLLSETVSSAALLGMVLVFLALYLGTRGGTENGRREMEKREK